MHAAQARSESSGGALESAELDFFPHLSEISRDSGQEFRSHHMAELPDHDWGSFSANVPRIDDSAFALLKTEDPHDLTEPPHSATKEPVLDVPFKRSKWKRRLVITKQPASEFYKDEGGKANALDVEVSLIEFDEHGEPARSPDDEFIDIPLRILLFFEDGKKVEDADQDIFRFVGNEYDSVVIRASTRKAAVQFRLEKVSRRKDGKRFRLRIEVDQEQCTANVADLTPIFTNAICVLSKRKHHTSSNDLASRVRDPPNKLLKRGLRLARNISLTRLTCSCSHRLDWARREFAARLDVLVEEMRRISRQVQEQNELLNRLFQPIPLNASVSGGQTSDQSTMEWFLKSGLADDATGRKLSAQSPSTALPYIYVTDDSETREGFQSSPSSSGDSPIQVAPPSQRLPQSSTVMFPGF